MNDKPSYDVTLARLVEISPDEDEYWAILGHLYDSNAQEVFDRAKAWCASNDDALKRRGFDILAQFGVKQKFLNPNRAEATRIIINAVCQEHETAVLTSAIYALGHHAASRTCDEVAVEKVVPFLNHPNDGLREAVCFVLGQFPDNKQSLAGLVSYMRDSCADIRDWATFAVGALSSMDSVEIREALLERLFDSNNDVRLEAIIGLARRNDISVLPQLILSLETEKFCDGLAEAARLMLGLDKAPSDWRTGDDWIAALRKAFPRS